MPNPECFGREYVDESGEECPYEDCLLRYECSQVFAAAKLLLRANNSEPEISKAVKPKFVESIKKRKVGYAKPGKLLYKDEGTLRDKLIFEVREYLEGLGYQTKSTKCLHSFLEEDKKFLLKVDTRRKNSILLYVQEDLSDSLVEKGFRCRALFDSEKPNFPSYLRWVAVLRGESDVVNFMSAFSELKGSSNDT